MEVVDLTVIMTRCCVITCMMVILKGAAPRQIDISLLETGRRPKTALAIPLRTRIWLVG